jgi:hypothetical protein
VCYEWCLQKKHKWSWHHDTCNDCGDHHVYPTGQGAAPSGQAASGQAYGYGAGQRTFQFAKPATSIASAPAEMTPAIPGGGEEAPPAPEVRETSAIGSQNGGLLLPTPSGN